MTTIKVMKRKKKRKTEVSFRSGNFCPQYLLAVDQLLREDTVVVADAVPVGSHAQGGHGVEEAGGQAAQTTVT